MSQSHAVTYSVHHNMIPIPISLHQFVASLGPLTLEFLQEQRDKQTDRHHKSRKTIPVLLAELAAGSQVVNNCGCGYPIKKLGSTYFTRR